MKSKSDALIYNLITKQKTKVFIKLIRFNMQTSTRNIKKQ